MKTLREYIDQLDEISRRDFLKGAGATAGLAAMGAPKDVKANDDRAMTMLLVLYYACKNPPPNNPNFKPPAEVCSEVNNLIQQFIQSYNNGRSIIQGAYSGVYEQLEKLIKDALQGKGQPPQLLMAMIKDSTLQQKTIRDFKNTYLATFGQAPTDQQLASVRNAMMREEEVDEAASPDAVARIEELVKYK